MLQAEASMNTQVPQGEGSGAVVIQLQVPEEIKDEIAEIVRSEIEKHDELNRVCGSRVYTPEDVCELLQISPDQLHRMRERGLPYVRLSERKIFFRERELDEFLQKHMVWNGHARAEREGLGIARQESRP